MDENEQKEFIAWLSQQLEAKDQDDLQQKVEQLGDEGIKQAHIEFQKSKVKQYMTGGRLEKIAKLVEYKQKGGLLKGGTKAVKDYQAMLNSYGANLKEDGAWGMATQKAYEDYLSKYALTGENQTAKLKGKSKTSDEPFTPIAGDGVAKIPDGVIPIKNNTIVKSPTTNYYNPLTVTNSQFNFSNGKTEIPTHIIQKAKALAEVYPALFKPRPDLLQGKTPNDTYESPWLWEDGNKKIDYGPQDLDLNGNYKKRK